MEATTKFHLIKTSMHYGAIVGGLLSVPMLLFYISGNINSPQLQSLHHILCFPSIAFYIRWYRNKFSDGELSFGKAVRVGFTLMLFTSFIIAFVTFLIYTLDGEMFSQYTSLMKEAVLTLTTSQEFKKLWIESINLMTPTTIAIGKIFEFCIFGLIFSIIISIFVRKNRLISNN